MSLLLLPNNVWHDAAQIKVTDSLNVETTDSAGLESVIGGPRSIYWTSGATDARRIALVNKDGTLSCSHIILARADWHLTKNLSLISWSNYSSTSTTEYSTASFAESLIGPREQDWVYPLELSSKQAIGVSFNSTGYTKLVNKFFVSNAITLEHYTAPSFQMLPFPSRHQHLRQQYLVDRVWNISVEKLTKAEVDTIEAIPNLLSEPLFIYDADGTSIYHKLIFGIISDHQVTAAFNDLYQLSLTVRELRQWP